MTVGNEPRVAPRAPERPLEAPHRRGGQRPRIVERVAVVAYKATAWLLQTLPADFAAAVIGRLSQASYLAWGTKRHWSDRNFAHVLGLPQGDPRVRAVALRAYYLYGRYLVELMRLPALPPDDRGRPGARRRRRRHQAPVGR